MFIVLGVLILVTFVILTGWQSRLDQIVECNQKVITYWKERPRGTDAAIILDGILEQTALVKRFRRTAPREELDIEHGIKRD